MSTNTVKDRDLGYDDILGGLKDLADGKFVVVGVRSAAGGKDTGNGFNLASLAATHEFGSEKAGVPERSFLRSTVDAQKEAIADRMETAVVKVLESSGYGEVDTQLGLLGVFVAGEVQKAIANRTIGGPPNAESTTRPRPSGKGSSVPLIDTGRLRASIDSEVRSE